MLEKGWMMAIVNDLRKIIANKDKLVTVKKHVEFYDSMVKQGIAKKQEYNIPMIDTVGIRCVKDNSNYFI